MSLNDEFDNDESIDNNQKSFNVDFDKAKVSNVDSAKEEGIESPDMPELCCGNKEDKELKEDESEEEKPRPGRTTDPDENSMGSLDLLADLDDDDDNTEETEGAKFIKHLEQTQN
jgi:hypothetical protein